MLHVVDWGARTKVGINALMFKDQHQLWPPEHKSREDAALEEPNHEESSLPASGERGLGRPHVEELLENVLQF